MPDAIWKHIDLMPETQFQEIRNLAKSNDFMMVASGANGSKRHVYALAKQLRQHGIDVPQEDLLQSTRLAVHAIMSRICRTVNPKTV